MSELNKKYDPIWQLEQNLKTHRTNAITWWNESAAALRRAEEADQMADEYELAINRLKEVKP